MIKLEMMTKSEMTIKSGTKNNFVRRIISRDLKSILRLYFFNERKVMNNELEFNGAFDSLSQENNSITQMEIKASIKHEQGYVVDDSFGGRAKKYTDVFDIYTRNTKEIEYLLTFKYLLALKIIDKDRIIDKEIIDKDRIIAKDPDLLKTISEIKAVSDEPQKEKNPKQILLRVFSHKILKKRMISIKATKFDDLVSISAKT